MNDATDEYGCRPTDPDWMRQVAKDNNQPGVNVRWERTVKVHDDWYKPTPDPPARDWLVPTDTMEALREASARFHEHVPIVPESGRWSEIVSAARAVLDAATEVER